MAALPFEKLGRAIVLVDGETSEVVPNASEAACREEKCDSGAKERARAQEPSQVKVHKSDRNMEYESTSGEDPRRSPS